MKKRRQAGICVYCLGEFPRLTDDHVLPRSWYPATTPANVAKRISSFSHTDRWTVRDGEGRFTGSCRTNVEDVPRLPAWLVARVWDYGGDDVIRLRWESSDSGRTLDYLASRENGFIRPGVWVRPEGGVAGVVLSVAKRPGPGGGFKPLVSCPVWLDGVFCGRRVRYLYGFGSSLSCRPCAGLRYASEGHWSRLNRVFGSWPRNPRWGDPRAFLRP